MRIKIMARRKNRNNAQPSEETPSTNVSDLEQSPEQATVNDNTDGEATAGTTKDGEESSVENVDSVPQNGVTEIATTPAPNDIARESDENRTEEEVRFADESNPNQKGRSTSAPTEHDQDGNLRTDGYSYGVAPDDTRGVNPDSFDENRGEAPEKPENKFEGKVVFTADRAQTDTVNQDDPNVEVSDKQVAKLEKSLSDPDNGISVRVLSSTSGFYRIKFLRNNKPLAIYKSRGAKLDKKEVKAFLSEAVKRET